MSRIFGHLDGEPEDRWFSKIARLMRRSPWWTRLPVRDEPDDVSGVVEAREVGAGKVGGG